MLEGGIYLARLRQIENRAEQDKQDRESLLRLAGWEYFSNNPGSRWLWSKQFPASTIQKSQPALYAGVSTDIALIIETSWRSLYTDKDDPCRLPEREDD